MDQESSGRSMMSSLCESLSAWLARTLDEAERESVLGDLREAGEGGWNAVSQILGLVLRRQAGAAKDRCLQVALVALVAPFAFLLSAVSQDVIGAGALYAWMYVNNWDWGLATTAGFWYVLREAALELSTSCMLLACWSWSAGFVLGRLSKQFVWTCQAAFVVLLALSQALALPQRFAGFLMRGYRPSSPPLVDPNAPVTANAFYRAFFPWIVVAAVLVLPALLGIRQARRPRIRNGGLHILLGAAAIISLFTMLLRLPGIDILAGDSGREWLGHNRSAIKALSLAGCWPALYLAAIGLGRYWRAGRSAA